MRLDTMSEYVRRRLGHWGDEFALHRDVEWLGYATKNILKVLMEHRGMPGRAQGFKPVEADALAQEIEDIVSALAKENRQAANVLRAYYCGRGRAGVERYETANMLITGMGDRAVSLRQYHLLRRVGENFVLERVVGSARAA